ncbi:endonuclease domain-containing protein [Sporosarcina sp. FSL K6-3457]|uniref:endonuclease domain-containing protein n=1 Tax=Sporosarcina sp. FSL K6-3457 TaxID=2978204 RepID=UPI0030FBFB43
MKSKLEKSVLDYLDGVTGRLLDEGNEIEDIRILKCESPIEQLMFLALEDLFKHFDLFCDRFLFNIEVQEEVVFRNAKYRTDITLSIADMEREINHEFVIECDGHDFHEKTKEQVRKDKQRERRLMRLGYRVIRFSGSEIFEDPDESALEVWEIVKKVIY